MRMVLQLSLNLRDTIVQNIVSHLIVSKYLPSRDILIQEFKYQIGMFKKYVHKTQKKKSSQVIVWYVMQRLFFLEKMAEKY